MLIMDKHSRIKLMRRKKKLFPWLRTFYSKYSEKFFSAENTDNFEYLFLNVEKEMKDIYLELNEEKSEDFFNILNSLFLHFCWQIHWNSCKKWKTYWNKVKTTEVSIKDSHRKCCVLLLHYMILLSIFLTGGDEKSDWIGRILIAMKSLPDAADILCSALLLTSDLKKKHKPVYSIILKHTLCCDSVKNTIEPQTYCKVILLFRRLLKLTKDKKEKAHILLFAAKLKVPSDIQNWLSSQNIDDSKDLNYVDNLTQELLSRSYPDELLRKLSEILTEDSFCKKYLTLDSVDAYSIPSISKVSVSEGLNRKIDEDLESFDKTHLQNGLDGIRTTASCITAENLSNDVDNRIKDNDLNKEVQNRIEEMSDETNVNHCSESLQKTSKNQKLENVKSKRDCHKKKKAKTSKESSRKHKKNERKSKETLVTTALKISDEFETCSKLNVLALDIDECTSNATSKENVSRDLNRELNENLLGSFDKTNLQNDLDGIRTTTSCIAAKNLSNVVNNRITDKDLNKEVQNSIEKMSGETNINHCSEPLQKPLKTQNLENVKSKRDSHKKKKAKTSKESSKKHKKNKKKSKETPVTTALKISDEFETCSELNVPALDIDKCPSNVTSKENVSEGLNSELDKDLLGSLGKTSIQNGMKGVETTLSSTVVENTSNDINNIIKNKDKTKEELNPIEGMSGETNVNHCLKTCKKQKLENEESEKSKSKKKKKDKILKESSKKDKKKKKKSKEKPQKTAVKTNEGFEPKFKLSVDINVAKNNISEDLNGELEGDILESVFKTDMQNDLNVINSKKKDEDLHNMLSNPMEGICNEINVACCSESLKKASKKRKLENEESERRNHKKKKKEKRLKDSAKDHKKKEKRLKDSAKDHKKKEKRLKDSAKDLKKKKSKEKPGNTALNIGEEFVTYSNINVPASDIDIPSNFSSKENVSEDLSEALLKSSTSDMQKDLNGTESTTSCIAAENNYIDINNRIKNKDLRSVVSNPMKGTCGESLEKISKKQKFENDDSERCNHKKKKKDKVLKLSSKDHKKNKKKSKEKSDKNKGFEIPCIESNSQKHKKSKQEADKTAVEINKELETCPQLDLATSHVIESHQSRKSLDNEIENSSKQHNCSLNSVRKRSKSTSNIGESHDFENPLDLKISHEQQDYNMKTKRKRSKSENEKKERSHSKKSKRQSREKKVNKYKEVTDFDLPDTVLPGGNFSESENLLPQIENQSQKEMKKHPKEKLQISAEFLKTAGFDNSDIILSVNNFSDPENSQYVCSINESDGKKSKKKDRWKEMSEEKNSSDSISKGNCYKSYLIKKNTIDEFRELPKVKRKKLFNNDLYCLKKSQKEIQTSTTIANNCIVPTKLSPSKRHSFLDNNDTNDCIDSANLDVNSNFSSSEETTAFSDVSMSDLLDFPKVDIYRHNAALGIVNNPTLKSKRKKKPNSNIDEQNKELSVLKNDLLMASKKILRQSYISETLKSQSFIHNESGAEETEKDDNQSTETLSFCSANIKESVVGSDFVDGNNVSKKCTSTDVLISKQSNEAKSTAVFQQSQFMNNARDTFLSMDCSSGQNFEAGIKIRTASSERSFCSFSHSSLNPSVVLNDVLQSKSAQKYVSSSEKSFASVSESDSKTQSSTPPQTDTHLEMSVSHELTSENIAKANELYGKKEGALMDLFRANIKSNSPSVENVSMIPIDDNLNHNTELSEFQSPSLVQAANIFLNESELFATSVLQSQLNTSVTKSQTNNCGTQYINTENVNHKSVGTSTEIINSNNVSSVQVIINFTGNEDCSESKEQFVAHFDFQTANDSERTPLISSVSFSPANASTPMINYNHNPNLDSTKNHDPQHIIQFNQTTNSIEKSVNSNRCSNANLSHKREKNGQCVALNDSGLSQTLCSKSSPTIVNNSNNITQCHPQLFSNAAALNSGKKAFSHSSFSKNENPLSQDGGFQLLSTENLDSLNGESNELSLKAKVVNNDSSFRTSTIYSDESTDSSSLSSASNYLDCETEVSDGETLKVGASSEPAVLSKEKESFCKNDNSLLQERNFKPLTTENLDSLNRETKAMSNDTFNRSSTIHSGESDDSTSLSSISNYSEIQREVAAVKTPRTKTSSKYKSCRIIEFDSDYSNSESPLTPKSEPVEIDETKSKDCSNEVGSLRKSTSNKGNTPEKNIPPVNNNETKSKECSKEDSSLSKSTSNKRKTSEKNLSPVNNHETRSSSKQFSKDDSSLSKSTFSKGKTPEENVPTVENHETKSKECSKEDDSLSKSTSNKGKTPEENVPPVNNRYNLRARKALQTRQLFGI